MRQLGSAYSRGVERHQHGAVKRSRCGVDQPRNVPWAEYLRQVDDLLRIRSLFGTPGLLESLDEKEAQGSDPLIDGVGA